MVTYLKDANAALLGPVELSERLAMVLREAMPWLLTISEASPAYRSVRGSGARSR